MKLHLFVGALLCGTIVVSASAQSSHSVRGYTRKDGTYVAPHRATNPNGTLSDNWSTKGNVNPDTGKPGTVDPYRAPSWSGASTGAEARKRSAF
ncbi:hypothetical protein HD841_002107 [Sphingomonas melonis]|uniref:Lipoprotein n=1 Tax=Sphingomonas melonis TaxID=152682 RepID=A0A7Y9FNM4_9SPHN|nr:hypothetical protein [Sphingomonas melonis]